MWVLLGILLLIALTVDVFITVFYPEGHGGPISRWQNRLIWWSCRAVSDHLTHGRELILTIAAPVMAIVTPAQWIVLLVGGFALIYYPSISTFLVSPGHLRIPFWESVYYSGYSASTLGNGDLVANRMSLRVLTSTEALSGLGLGTASFTYILSIYRELGTMTTLALDIQARFDAAPPEQIQLHDPIVLDSWGRWMEATAVELHHIRQAHTQYPILHYFWTRDRRQALSVQLRKIVGLYEGDTPLSARDDAGRLMSHPGPRSMELAVNDYINDVLARFVDPRGRAEGEDLRGSLSKLNRYMRYE